jgi:hypothetical protein
LTKYFLDAKTYMTVHWKALEERFLMALTVLGWIHCEGSHQFSDFTQNVPSLQ